MSATRIAGRYAKSLVDLAQEQGKLDVIKGNVDTFIAATDNRDFSLLLKNPIVTQSKKASVFKALFGEQFDELTMAFLDIVLRKGREEFLPQIANEFQAQYRAIKGQTKVHLITASALSDENLAEIKSKLLGSSATDKEVEITTEIDPSLIGGFVIKIGDKLYDNSIAYQLGKLKKEFKSDEFVKTY